MYKVLLLGAFSLLPSLKYQLLFLSSQQGFFLPRNHPRSLSSLTLDRTCQREVRWGRGNPKTFIVNFKMESGYEQTQKRRETSQTQK